MPPIGRTQGRPHRSTLIAWALLLILTPLAVGDVYVSPSGNSRNSGSMHHPLDLATALSDNSPARPGDMIWLLGGRYVGKFVCEISGATDRPIIIRSYPGQWACIDSGLAGDRQNILEVQGSWIVFRDFEVMSSDPTRATRIPGSNPGDIKRGEGIQVRARNVKLINLVVHDASVGIGAWAEAPDTEIYGCIIYHNGWQAPDRAHGHGIYSQNRTGLKTISDNIIFNQFDKGIQIYGSSKAKLRNYLIEGNTIFNNGIIADEHSVSENIIMYGGEGGPQAIVIRDNFLYGSDFSGKLVLGGTGAKDIVFQQNYVPQSVRFRHWEHAIVTDNTWLRDDTLVELHVPGDFVSQAYTWDRNSYYFDAHTSCPGPFQLHRLFSTGIPSVETLRFNKWRTATAFDHNSEYTSGRPCTSIFVRPNRYEIGRANITVYNWDYLPEVSVDLRSAVPYGMAYEIVNAQNYFGHPVVSGTFTGTPVLVPLTDRTVAAPAGLPRPPSTAPEFNVFVVRPATVHGSPP